MEAADTFRAQFPHEGEHTATWGHLGNYHLHFNFLPRNEEELEFAGDRETIRARATVAALHLVRRLVTET